MKSQLQASSPSSILLVANKHVGNNLFLTPAIRLLKKNLPATRLDVVTMSPRGADVFEGNSDIASIHTVYCRLQMRRLIRNYSAVIGLNNDISNRYLSGTPVQTWIIGNDKRDRHRADQVMEFVRELLGCEVTDEDRRYVLCAQHKHARRVEELLHAVRPDERLVCLHLGNGRTAGKGWMFWYRGRDKDPRLWPQENYVALARILSRENPKIRYVLTGSRHDRFLGARFIREIPDAISLMGATSLLDMAALMQRLGAVVTQDTGVVHIACVSNVPIIGMYGPTNPMRTGPYPARPWRTVIKKTTMAGITPEEVSVAVLSALR